MTSTHRSAIWIPLFDELADPRVVSRLAAEAEEAGWDGFFVWDHLTWEAPVAQLADPWISLAAIAGATESLRLGPMVTPVARRRPAKLARETASLDILSDGRLTFGAGLGRDVHGAELRRTGEQIDDRVRAEMLDEALEVVTAAWSGQAVRHRGSHYVVDDITFLPTPAQRSQIPVWIAGYAGRPKPVRRSARFDGFFPLGLQHPDELVGILETIRGIRDDPDAPFDIALPIAPGTDPAEYVAAGATWCLTDFEPEDATLDTVRGVVRDGPVLLAHKEGISQ